ncbi:MAG: hypothetical protein ABSH50_08265 [Bryobacteraceae bacterium]
MRLFSYLADEANKGHALGISYADFIAYLHGAASFRDLTGRSYRPSDTGVILAAAQAVTAHAGGRKPVSRLGKKIDAGMDTFIWSRTPPFDRPEAAWLRSAEKIPYSREVWLSVFPPNLRRLVIIGELEAEMTSSPTESPTRTGGDVRSALTSARASHQPVPRQPISDMQVSNLWRRLGQFLHRLDPKGSLKEGIGSHISRLSFEGVVPREVAAAMRTVTEARNAVDHEFKALSRVQSALVFAAWAAIEEWAAGKGLKI